MEIPARKIGTTTIGWARTQPDCSSGSLHDDFARCQIPGGLQRQQQTDLVSKRSKCRRSRRSVSKVRHDMVSERMIEQV